ncbi:EAL domain-containing protein [Parasalinivibrio latis]|uniref:EAL domain-containing protein n=1 Tax=Parasalinivibrio latis TaxID=2952610 RepID=UPI0030DDF45C
MSKEKPHCTGSQWDLMITTQILWVISLAMLITGHSPLMQFLAGIGFVITSACLGRHFYGIWKIFRLRVKSSVLEQFILVSLDKGEYQFFFQPLMCFQTREIVGGEMLLRMPDNQGGYISPETVVRVACDHGLVKNITQQALRDAQMVLNNNSNGIQVTVNIEPIQLWDIDELEDILSQYTDLSNNIILELTETEESLSVSRIAEGVRRIRNMGFKIWLDDFGTGQNSLKLWSATQVDGLKLAKSFVESLHDQYGQEWLKNISSLCNRLNVLCVMEGVENEAEVKVAENLGIEIAQGFYYYRPQAQQAFLTLLETHIKRNCMSCRKACPNAKREVGGNVIAMFDVVTE